MVKRRQAVKTICFQELLLARMRVREKERTCENKKKNYLCSSYCGKHCLRLESTRTGITLNVRMKFSFFDINDFARRKDFT